MPDNPLTSLSTLSSCISVQDFDVFCSASGLSKKSGVIGFLALTCGSAVIKPPLLPLLIAPLGESERKPSVIGRAGAIETIGIPTSRFFTWISVAVATTLDKVDLVRGLGGLAADAGGEGSDLVCWSGGAPGGKGNSHEEGVGPPVDGVILSGERDLTGEFEFVVGSFLSPCGPCDKALEEGRGKSIEY